MTYLAVIAIRCKQRRNWGALDEGPIGAFVPPGKVRPAEPEAEEIAL
jgi:hypothetical protein